MIRRLLLGLGLLIGLASGAQAAACTVPYTFVNGQLIQGPQITADFNAILGCVNTVNPIATVNVYVATTGNDANDCLTAPTACLTIRGARNVLNRGDQQSSTAVINIGAGSFCGAQFSGVMRGNAGSGVSGQYIELLGAGEGVTFITTSSACGGGAYEIEASNGANITLRNLTINVGSGEAGVYAQNPSTVVQLPHVTFSGAAGASQAIHAEANSLIESQAGSTITFTGEFGSAVAIGSGGQFELDPDGANSSHIACSGLTVTSALLFAGESGFMQLQPGWSFTGCPAGSPAYSVVLGGSIYNTTGAPIPGTAGAVGNGGFYYDIATGSQTAFGAACQTRIFGDASSGFAIADYGTNCNQIVQAQGAGSVILRSGGLTSATFLAPGSAVNGFAFSGSATGSPIEMAAVGGDTNIFAKYSTKGTGAHQFYTGSGLAFAVEDTGATAVNHVGAYGAATTGSPTLLAEGSDATINLILGAKNSGGSVVLQNNGLTSATFLAPAGAVNGFAFSGSATGSSIEMAAVGGDANIGLTARMKGIGIFSVAGNFAVTQASPAAADACTAGQIVADTGFLYTCSASGAWKRVAVVGGY